MTKINNRLYYAYDSSYPSFASVDENDNLSIQPIHLPNSGYIYNLIEVDDRNKILVISAQEENIEMYKIEIKD